MNKNGGGRNIAQGDMDFVQGWSFLADITFGSLNSTKNETQNSKVTCEKNRQYAFKQENEFPTPVIQGVNCESVLGV